MADHGAIVPSLWRLEVANSLTDALRRGRIDAEFRNVALADLAVLDVRVDPETELRAWGPRRIDFGSRSTTPPTSNSQVEFRSQRSTRKCALLATRSGCDCLAARDRDGENAIASHTSEAACFFFVELALCLRLRAITPRIVRRSKWQPPNNRRRPAAARPGDASVERSLHARRVPPHGLAPDGARSNAARILPATADLWGRGARHSCGALAKLCGIASTQLRFRVDRDEQSGFDAVAAIVSCRENP